MKNKTFDCVQMKWDIQNKQRKEFAGLSEADRRRIQAEKVQADPILGPFIQHLRQAPIPLRRR